MKEVYTRKAFRPGFVPCLQSRKLRSVGTPGRPRSPKRANRTGVKLDLQKWPAMGDASVANSAQSRPENWSGEQC